MNASAFNCFLELRIDWSELDYFAHVNNVSYFKYIQSARLNYWDKIGLTQWHRDTHTGPLLASCTCHFKLPLFYPGNISIRSRVDFIKTTSFGICHHVLNNAGELAAEAHDVLVMYDFKENQKINIPQEIITSIELLEQKSFR